MGAERKCQMANEVQDLPTGDAAVVQFCKTVPTPELKRLRDHIQNISARLEAEIVATTDELKLLTGLTQDEIRSRLTSKKRLTVERVKLGEKLRAIRRVIESRPAAPVVEQDAERDA
jgi:hypothetical protein